MKRCNVETARGTKCQRASGWGTGTNKGPCREHLRLQARRNARKRGLSVIEGGPGEAPPENLLTRPMFLPDKAGALWDSLVEKLTDAKVLEEVDGPALMNLVMAYHFALYAGALLLKEGMVQTDSMHKDRMRKHPAFQMWRDSQAAFGRWADKFKVNPAARQGALAKAEDDLDEMTRYLSGTNS